LFLSKVKAGKKINEDSGKANLLKEIEAMSKAQYVTPRQLGLANIIPCSKGLNQSTKLLTRYDFAYTFNSVVEANYHSHCSFC
jgi:hypothetical protein